LLIICYGSRGV